MKIVIDIEANALENPTKIWVIVCKDVDTGTRYVFRKPTEDKEQHEAFLNFANLVECWIGHNILSYDLPHLKTLLGLAWSVDQVVDTLVISKLVAYSRPGHSIAQYGEEFQLPKGDMKDFSKFTPEMEEYCGRDVAICERIYRKYKRIIDDPEWQPSIRLEQEFELVCSSLHSTGFGFNVDKANRLLVKVEKELAELDDKIKEQFPARLKLIREITPRETKHGTISLSSIPLAIRKAEGGDLSAYQPDAPFCFCSWSEFNPSSHKQLIEVLTEAGWKPVDKTKTHIEAERELQRLKYTRNRDSQVDARTSELYNVLTKSEKYGWKINEENLSTLPTSAPSSAKSLAKRIMLESRRRTLTEWLGLVSQDDGRIHGKFYGIGAWTHRMAHQNPNTANIPTGAKLYGDEMRSLWCAPYRKRLLVGVDAEGIQLRIFAHYINDPEFTESLVKGKKDDKTDPHSLNQRILGSVCKSRQHAKRFIFAYLLGAGIGKLAEILECSKSEGEEALDRLIERYVGLSVLKATIIPQDASRGWFRGLDGRKVRIPGETPGHRKHLTMSGYLQNGEAVVMKKACLKWASKLKKYDACLVNFVHDEWQTECPNDMKIALKIAKAQANSLREVGEELNLNCPLAGSYWNDDLKDYTIGSNWKVTH